MKTEIQIFNNPQFGEIRIIAYVNNEPLFCAADVCKALGYSNPRDAIAKHVDKEDVAKRDAWVETGKKADGTTAIRKTKMSFVNESGLYSLIFGSKLESAKSFKRWVTSEILPSIRKHGAYATPTTIESIIANPETGIKLLMALKEEREARLEAEKKNEENAPKVLFADAVIGSESSCLIGELAKILTQNGYKIRQNR